MTEYQNPKPVCVALVIVRGKLLMIRRKLEDGYGKLALPGGYQNIGETWQEAVAREFEEETGYPIPEHEFFLMDVVTVENGTINLIFGYSCYDYDHDPEQFEFSDDETLEVVLVDKTVNPEDIAFPAHYEMAIRFLEDWDILGEKNDGSAEDEDEDDFE